MELESCVPPGFRFYPTEEELVGYYLARKVASHKIDLEVIADIDLYRMEPWDLQDRQKLGYEEQNEWYFFSHKDKKYPTGTRTNRATAAGFWKATGRDKAVLSKSSVIGMRKTLVFYVGRAPNGRKTDWIMHEYRLQSSEHEPPQEEGWVVCRAFRKQTPNQRPCFNAINPGYYIRDQDPFGEEALADVTRTTRFMDSFLGSNLCEQQFGGEGELEAKQTHNLSTSLATKERLEHNTMANKEYGSQRNDCEGQFIDWKVLDKLLASQLSESATDSISNVPMIPLNCDTDAQDQDHFLASFHS